MGREVRQIVATDNFARDTVAETCVLRLHMSEGTANGIALLLNHDRAGTDTWYVVKDADYKPWLGMEEFV